MVARFNIQENRPERIRARAQSVSLGDFDRVPNPGIGARSGDYRPILSQPGSADQGNIRARKCTARNSEVLPGPLTNGFACPVSSPRRTRTPKKPSANGGLFWRDKPAATGAVGEQLQEGAGWVRIGLHLSFNSQRESKKHSKTWHTLDLKLTPKPAVPFTGQEGNFSACFIGTK